MSCMLNGLPWTVTEALSSFRNLLVLVDCILSFDVCEFVVLFMFCII